MPNIDDLIREGACIQGLLWYLEIKGEDTFWIKRELLADESPDFNWYYQWVSKNFGKLKTDPQAIVDLYRTSTDVSLRMACRLNLQWYCVRFKFDPIEQWAKYEIFRNISIWTLCDPTKTRFRNLMAHSTARLTDYLDNEIGQDFTVPSL